tara:strand:+ start:187 stop:642 length:456 start_codon:yes stop_codon:yes gene_type:complete
MIKVNVEVNNKTWHTKLKKPEKYLNLKLKKIIKIVPFFRKKNLIFTILLTNSSFIKKLNKKFRKKNKPTDVLSFPFSSKQDLKLKKEKNIYIGDIAVCYEIIKKRSKKTDFFLEFNKVWVHGLLHLIGYNHIKNKDYIKMAKIEEKIISLL